MKLLLIGDLHIKPSNLEESGRLFDFINNTFREHKCDYAVFLGDQADGFGLANTSVLQFLNAKYRQLATNAIQSISLIGNHDQEQDGSSSYMWDYSDYTNVVGRTSYLFNRLGFVGFIRKEEDFYKSAMDMYTNGAKIIFCHIEANGAQYDNGFYAPHGFDMSRYPKDLFFISGHIHKKQNFPNLWYTGTPRQLTTSDINETKGIWVFDTDSMVGTFIQTPESVCMPFKMVEIVEGNPAPTLTNSNKCAVKIIGSQEFIRKTIKGLPNQITKISSQPVDEIIQATVRESDGMPKAFAAYANEYFATTDLNSEQKAAVLEMIYSSCNLLKVGVDVTAE